MASKTSTRVVSARWELRNAVRQGWIGREMLLELSTSELDGAYTPVDSHPQPEGPKDPRVLKVIQLVMGRWFVEELNGFLADGHLWVDSELLG